MANTEYAILKHHFDRLIFSSSIGTGLEPIRDTYEVAFGMKIHQFDIYQTQLKSSRNPINAIVTLVGPEQERTVPTGIISSANDICSVSVFWDDIFKGIRSEDGPSYINTVYHAMDNVVMMDRFYASDIVARENPHMTFIKACPFYFTYHHIKESLNHLLDEKVFIELLEKYIANPDDVGEIMKSISTRKYSADPEVIYSTMTCNGTIELFR